MYLMKRLNIFLFFISTSFLVASALFSSAQEYTATNYYYNNFDGGALGSNFSQIGAQPALAVSGNSPLVGGSSLASNGNGTAGGFNLSFLPNNTNLNNTEWGYEWTFVYRNNDASNPASSDNVTNGSNLWQYWLLSDNADVNQATGYYITHKGNSLMLRYRIYNNGYPYWADGPSYAISNNTTYAIRVQRSKRGSQYIWMLFVDPYTATIKEASTRRGSLWYHYDQNLYRNSSLRVSSTTANRFKFDEMKTYSMQLLISGANDASNGISNPLYASQQNAVLYGLQMQTRGLFDMYQFKVELTGSLTSVIDNTTVKINKSTDSYFGNTDDFSLITFASNNVYNSAIQYYGDANNPFSSFWSVGNADGSMATACYYFITANVKSNPTGAFAFSGAPLIKSGNTEVNYPDNTGTVVSSGTGDTNSGNVKDWIGGTSSNWNVAGNWSPSGVPGTNDLARIGVVTFTNQPEVSNNLTVGNIQFGTTKTATLTVNSGYTLTVKNTVENLEGITITGTGTLDIQGSYVAKPTTAAKTTIASIATLNVVNFVLNTQTKAATFNANGTNILIKNALQTIGVNTATFILGNNTILTLTGVNPFSLDATTNAVTLNNGTVIYGAATQQNASTAFSYKDIGFSGAGMKMVASGSLNISGDWNSEGGKVDLLSNETSVVFNGSAQAIKDTGSDSGNGVAFGNLTLLGGTKTLSTTGKFALAVGKYLTLGTSTIFQTSNNLTLKASVLGSASVSQVPANSSIKGKVIVEKYIQGGSKEMWRTSRMLSSPVYDNTTDFRNADVENERKYSFVQFIDDMIITGKGGKANGFDVNAGNAASAFTYNKGFKEIEKINTSVNVGTGAYIFFRGNRDNISAKVTAPFVDAESIVMTFEGVLNQQNVTVPLSGANLVGNPYAATIDWNAVTKAGNVSQVIRVWNPSNRQYSTYNGQYGVNGGTRYIGPGQAFFVQTDGASASITFTEASKVGSVAQTSALYNVVMSTKESNLVNTFKLGASSGNSVLSTSNNILEQPSIIRVKLLRDGTENNDETLVILKSNELATVSGDDVTKMNGESVFLSSLSQEGKQMAINYMPQASMVSNIKLNVSADNSGAYRLLCTSEDIPLGYEAKLKDKFLNTITNLNTENAEYLFSIDKTIAASYGSERFEILLTPITTLPVTVSEFLGNRVNEGVLLKWKTSSQQNNSHFEIKRAGEEQIYTTIGKVEANQDGVYNLLDKSPIDGNNYYTLVQVDKDGTQHIYEQKVVVKYQLNNNTLSELLIYPTLVESAFTLKYTGDFNSNRYVLKITDITGKEIVSSEVDKNTIRNGYAGVLPTVSSGVYFATLVDAVSGKKIETTKLVRK